MPGSFVRTEQDLRRVAGVFALLASAASAASPAPVTSVAAPAGAPVAYLVDLSSNAVLLDRDADKRILPASMTKMLTAYVVFDRIRSRRTRLSDTFVIPPAVTAKWSGPGGGATMYLKTGERVSVADLLRGTLTLSGNDACIALARAVMGSEAAFVTEMNRTAVRLGLARSRFATPNGWPDGGKTHSSARDLALLATATIRDHPVLYRQFYGQRNFTWGATGKHPGVTQDNRDPILGRVSGADGLKTGHTRESGFSFTGSAERRGRRLVMVVAGAPSFAARSVQSVALMQWGFDAFHLAPILTRGKRVGEAAVQLGDAKRVGLVTPRPVFVSVPRRAGGTAVVRARIRYRGPLRAPIRAGQQVADLIVETAGMAPQVTPLLAERAVGTATFLDRAWHGALGLIA